MSSHNRITRKSLSLSQRIDVIRQHERKQSARRLAKMYKCSINQIKNILRRKQEYLDEWHHDGSLNKMKRRQFTRVQTVGSILTEWYKRCRLMGIPVNDEQMLEVAKTIVERMNLPQVRPCKSWLNRFKDRFKLHESSFDQQEEEATGIEKKPKLSLNIDDIIKETRSTLSLWIKSNKEQEDQLQVEIRSSTSEEYFTDDNTQNSGEHLKKDTIETTSCSASYDHIDGQPFTSIHTFNLDIVKTEMAESNSDIEREEPSSSSSGKIAPNISTDVPILATTAATTTTTTINNNNNRNVLNARIDSYKEAYNILGVLEGIIVDDTDVQGLQLVNELKTHFLTKISNVKLGINK